MVLNKFCEKSSNKKKLTLVSITGGPCSPVKEGHTALILDPQQTIVNIKRIAARPGQTEQEQKPNQISCAMWYKQLTHPYCLHRTSTCFKMRSLFNSDRNLKGLSSSLYAEAKLFQASGNSINGNFFKYSYLTLKICMSFVFRKL